jgi:hypothetical protein
MQIPRSGYLTLLLAGCVLACLGWALQAYVDLLRMEASVVDTRARVETASRIRLKLVENLLQESREVAGSGALAQVDRAAARVREVGLLPELLEDLEGQAGFRDAQGELTAALDAVWSSDEPPADPALAIALSDLKPEIVLWSASLERGLAELARRLESFRASTDSFPGSLVVAIPRREGPAEEPPQPRTTHSGPPATTSGALH